MSHRSQYYLGGRKKYYPVGSDCVLYHAYWDGTATDHSSFGNDGTVTGATFTTVGGIPCLSFDGSDDNIKITGDSSLIIGTGDFTYCGWIFNNDLTNYRRLIEHIQDGNMGVIVQFEPETGTNFSYWLNSGATKYYRSSAYTFTSSWAFFAYIIDRDVGAYWKKNNGAFEGPGGILDAATNYNTNADSWIGSNYGIYGFFRWTGYLGQQLWFNVAKNNTELDDIYNFTKARYGL